MEKAVFIFIQLGTLLIMVIYGKRLSLTSNNRDYWHQALVPLLAYGVAYGLRFGRLIDWNLYYFRYVSLGKSLDSEEYEWLFEHICHFLYQLGVPYPGFIFLQCLFLMFSILLFFSVNKDVVRWGLPVAFVFCVSNEMFIRYYLGFSFSIIATYYLYRFDLGIAKRYLLVMVFTILGGLCHSACYFMLLVFASYSILNLKVISWKLSIPLLFLTTFVLKLSQFTFLIDVTEFLGSILGDGFHGAEYFQCTEDLINGDWGKVGYMERTFLSSIRSFIYIAPVLYYANKYSRKNSSDVFCYNLFVIGAILDPCFGIVELLNRISCSMKFFGCVPCALWYVSVLNKKGSSRNEFYIAVISVIFLLYPHIKDPFIRPEENGILFIWDSDGRNFLPF